MADLEADVDDVLSGEEEWEQAPSDIQEHSDSSGPASPGAENPPVRTTENAVLHLPLNLGGDGVTELAGQIGEMNVQHQGSANARSEPDGNARITSQAPVANDSNLSAPRISQGQNISSSGRQIAVPALETAGADGPLTPRNDVGPFILDGSGSRGDRRNVSNLESVVNGD
ncbi:MAG: hypothetical protein M1820_003306 [Bogoriella megaspora]|nr:MAG: hypothetical protein M1820_003306 [Bogoriella megaspora]